MQYIRIEGMLKITFFEDVPDILLLALQIYYMIPGHQQWPLVLSVLAFCPCCQAQLQRFPVPFSLGPSLMLCMLSCYMTIFLWLQQRPADNDRYVKNCRNGRSPKETRWWFHDDKVWFWWWCFFCRVVTTNLTKRSVLHFPVTQEY